MLYPLKFEPVLKNYLWGGENLRKFGKVFPEDQTVAESWELSCHPDGESIISNGQFKGRTLSSLIQEYNKTLVGTALPSEKIKRFPLLIKLIDAADNLSVQVHPDDEFAAKNENGELGKNEMWYVIDAIPGAKLIYDLVPGTTKEKLEQAIKDKKISNYLNEVPVKAGDFFNIPAGLVHAIGKGIVIAEVQQNSNTTYRVYDYDRTDIYGNSRELHIDKALQTINFSSNTNTCTQATPTTIKIAPDSTFTNLVTNSYFSVDKIELNDKITQKTKLERFHIYIVLDGNITISGNDYEPTSVSMGETVLIPACCDKYTIKGKATLLRALVP